MAAKTETPAKKLATRGMIAPEPLVAVASPLVAVASPLVAVASPLVAVASPLVAERASVKF